MTQASARMHLGVRVRERLWPALRSRLDLVVLGGVLAYVLSSNNPVLRLPLLPSAAPGGIVGLGLGAGSLLALQAVGMVMVLRSNRIINFAQVQLGVLTGVVFYELVHHVQLALGLQQLCGCLRGVSTDATFDQSNPSLFTAALLRNHYDGLVAANFWLALMVSLLLAPLLAWLSYQFLIKRFQAAPRLIATVVTIALAQVLVVVVGFVPGLFNDVNRDYGQLYVPLPQATLRWAPSLLHTGDLIAFAVPVVAGLALAAFLLLSPTGIAMRGAAENAERAQTLGLNVQRLASVSWMVAGGLSGLAAVVGVVQQGSSGALGGSGGSGSLDVPTLVQILAAVVFARMAAPLLAVAASLGLGVLQQVLLWNYSSSVPDQGFVLFPLIAAALLLQQSGRSRAEEEATAAYLAAREARPIPPELRPVPVVDSWLRWGGLAVAVLVFGFPFAMEPAQVSLGSFVLIYTIIGLSLLVLTGWAGQISLGQLAFAAVGGFVTALLGGRFGVFFPVNLLLGGLAGAAVAALVGIPAFRLRGLHLGVTTMAFGLGVTAVGLNPQYLGSLLPAGLSRPTIVGFSLDDERGFYFLCLGFVAIAVVSVLGLRRSRTARALIACRDNEQAGQTFGINLFWARVHAFAFAGFMAAVAGGLLVYQQHSVQPASFSAEQSVGVFLIVVIGGLGSVVGPLLGSLYNGVILMLSSEPLLALLGQGVGVVAILILYPGGLSAVAYALRDAWLRRVAIRYRIIVPSLLADTIKEGHEEQAVIAPKRRPGGGPAFVPVRYRMPRRWDRFTEKAG